MTKRMLIDALHPEEMRVVIADEKQIFDFDFASDSKKQIKGNIYLAKVTRVEPSLQAAFVEYGGGKQGFLPFAEIHPDYYQIPVSDRKRLMEEAEREETTNTNDDSETANQAGEAENQLPAEGADVAPEDDSAGGNREMALSAANAEEAEAVGELGEFPPLPLADALPEMDAEPEDNRTGFASSEVVSTQEIENAELAESLAQPDKKEGSEEDDVETLASDEEEISQTRKRNNYFRRYKIQEVIKRGQIVLVQVIKEERGNKGVSLTTFLSLAGRYCVLMPNSPKDGGISRKISDSTTRKRLKEVLSELKLANGMSVIIRTAGIDRTRAEIRRDFDYLVKLWNQIREQTLSSTAPALVYEESDLIKRSIRDQYTGDIDEVIVEGEAAYKSARDFMKMLLPSHTPRVKQYKENMPLFYGYGVEEQMLSMHDPVVKLKSGGYIVLNPTEALISIDVNSGRATGERNIEETATRTNLEAAAEVARQLRLRDLAGLIVIDFIDMYESRNRRSVERALKEALKSDRAKIQLGRISPFGLLEMSRQRLRPSIAETNNISCPHCMGRGQMRSNESMSIQIVRALEKEAATGNWNSLRLNAPENIALHLLNTKRKLLEELETRHGVSISIMIDHSLTASAFTIEKNRRGQVAQRERIGGEQQEEQPRRERGGRDRNRNRRGRDRDREERPRQQTEEIAEPVEETFEEQETESAATSDENRRSRRGRRGGRNRRRRENGPRDDSASAAQENEGDESFVPLEESAAFAEQVEDTASSDDNEEGPRRGRGRRGGRNRRRWREGEEEGSGENASSGEGERSSASDAGSLPAFTRSEVIHSTPHAPELVVSHEVAQPLPTQPVPPSTSRPDGAPPRKGWWQKIIELE